MDSGKICLLFKLQNKCVTCSSTLSNQRMQATLIREVQLCCNSVMKTEFQFLWENFPDPQLEAIPCSFHFPVPLLKHLESFSDLQTLSRVL